MRDDLLSSWKAIAAYLGRDERTCQRWEKESGLPIKRRAGSDKPSVYAFREDLNRWLANSREVVGSLDATLDWKDRSNPSPGIELGLAREKGEIRLADFGTHKSELDDVRSAGRFEKARRERHAWIPLWLLLLTVIGVAVLAMPAPSLRRLFHGVPFDFNVEGSEIFLRDAKNRILGSYDSQLDDLRGTEWYHSRFMRRNHHGNLIGSRPSLNPACHICDLEGDGDLEFLLFTASEEEVGAAKIICLDENADLLWEYQMGRPITYGSRHFPSDFYPDFIVIEDLNRDGSAEIVACAHAFGEFPTQIAVLSAAGRPIGEYWNAGQIGAVVLTDLEGNGRKEILLGGQNNEYRKGILLALDPERLGGGSPQSAKRYVCPELDPGSEMFYILLPKSRLEETLLGPGVAISHLRTYNDGSLQASLAETGLIFRFDSQLNLARPEISHTYMRLYDDILAQGRLREPFNEDRILAGLRAEGMLYWNGESFVSTPTPNARYIRKGR